MSRHFSQVLFDIENMSTEQLIDKYGIEINDDGSVYDPTIMSEFDNIDEWATYLLNDEEELESTPTFIKRTRKHHFDDED